jgi:ABC-type protease/lipase transport system fused ATPase/permease subunit
VLNEIAIDAYHRDQLRDVIGYVDPSRDSFDGTLLQNITNFQPCRYQRRALFWSFLAGLDAKVRALPTGYNTAMGTSVPIRPITRYPSAFSCCDCPLSFPRDIAT